MVTMDEEYEKIRKQKKIVQPTCPGQTCCDMRGRGVRVTKKASCNIIMTSNMDKSTIQPRQVSNDLLTCIEKNNILMAPQWQRLTRK